MSPFYNVSFVPWNVHLSFMLSRMFVYFLWNVLPPYTRRYPRSSLYRMYCLLIPAGIFRSQLSYLYLDLLSISGFSGSHVTLSSPLSGCRLDIHIFLSDCSLYGNGNEVCLF